MTERNLDLSDGILGYIENSEDTYVEFLKKLVRTDTTIIDAGYGGGNEEAGQKIILEFLRQIGCETEVFEPDNESMSRYPDLNPGHPYQNRPNVVGILRGNGGGRSLILNGHIDTMPVTDRELWQHDPFGGEISKGRLYGRGATDMKGGLAAGLCAVQALRECGVALCGDVIVQSVVDEEGGGNGTLACVERGYTADGAIVLEPTDMEIVIAGMGWVFYEVEVEGLATHAGSKWKGINAIEKCMRIAEELRELERRWLMTYRHPFLPGPTINIGKIVGGEGASTVPAGCVMTVGAHYQPSQSDEEGYWNLVEGELLDRIDSVALGDSWLKDRKPKVSRIQQGTPHELNAGHPLVSVLKEGILRVTWKLPGVGGVGYGCDARLLSNLAHVPTAVFGPGEPVQAHRRDESIDIADYLGAIGAIALTIMDWCGVAET